MSPLKLLVLVPESTQTGVYSAYGNLGYGVAPSCPNMDGQTAEIHECQLAIYVFTEGECLFEAHGEMDMKTERMCV